MGQPLSPPCRLAMIFPRPGNSGLGQNCLGLEKRVERDMMDQGVFEIAATSHIQRFIF
jgi:hypothetical protein